MFYWFIFCNRRDLNKDRDESLDDNKFYQDIEQNIYDDSSKFVPTQDYTKKCSIKKVDEGKKNHNGLKI